MGATTAITGGMTLQGLSGLLGAKSQSDTNTQNLQYQIAHQNQIAQYVNSLIQPGVNPYGQAMMSFIGRGLPGGTFQQGIGAGFGAQQPGGMVAGGNTGGGSNNPIPPGMVNPDPFGGGQINPSASMSLASLFGLGAPRAMAAAGGASAAPSGMPSVPGYAGGFTPQYSNIGGVDISQYIGQGKTFQDLVSQGVLTTDQVNQFFNFNPNDPLTTPGSAQNLYKTGIDSFIPNNPSQLQQAIANLPQQTAPQSGAPSYLQGGQTFNNLQQALAAFQQLQQNPGQAILPQMPGGTFTPDVLNQMALQNPSFNPQGFGQGGFGPGPALGAGSNMYAYQPTNPFTYNPTTPGQAPLIQNLPQVNTSGISAPTANVSPNAQAQQISGLPSVNPMFVSPTGTQALNTGQDALLQMMRTNLAPAQDPTLSKNLQDLGAGKDLYNTSDLFSSIDASAHKQLDQQVSALEGSAGSLGKRFGTAMQQNVGKLMSDTLTAENLQKQQIGMSAFQNAQSMRQPALNTMADLLGQQNQVGLAGQTNQLNVASTLAGLGQQQSQLGLNAQLANQSTSLAAQQGNLNASLGAATANQGAGLQASLANQSLLSQLAQFNASQGMNANQFNAQLGLQGQQTNLGAYMQAALANQGLLGQFQTNDANIFNQAGQFNAQMGQTAQQFNAQQGNIYNNLILSALSQAGGLQQGQSGSNAGLVGILNNTSVPQAQPSPWSSAIGNVGGMISLMPFLNQMYSNPGGGAPLQFPRQVPIGSFTPNTGFR